MSDIKEIEEALLEQSVDIEYDYQDELENGVEPWLEPVSGVEIANAVRNHVRNHCVLPEGADTAISLYIMASYTLDCWRIMPKLLVTSPEKRCGKTTLLEVIGALVHKKLPASSTTPSALFRAIDMWRPTLLIDEADTFLNGNDELNGIINSGHRRSSASVLRNVAVGNDYTPTLFSTFCCMIIVMIKKPRDTLIDRSVVIRLTRKRVEHKIARLPSEPELEWRGLRRKLQRWSKDERQHLKEAQVEVPNTGNDRAEDNWLPLLTIASRLDDGWYAEAIGALKTLNKRDDDEDSDGVSLLADIRDYYAQPAVNQRVSSEDLTEYLADLDSSPWGDPEAGKFSKNKVAALLKPFGIKPQDFKFSGRTLKDYERAMFSDAFA